MSFGYRHWHIGHSIFTVFIKVVILFLSTGSLAIAQAPTINSFTPTTICQGEDVIITGTNFTGTTKVKLGTDDAVSFKVTNATSITAKVANTAASGTVIVTTPD